MYNILLFDDSLYVLKYLEAGLKKHSGELKIFKCQNYDDAVEIVNTEKIDIAFIDLQVPEKNGADFILYLKGERHLQNIRKIIITETGKNSLLKVSLENEVDAYLHKEEVFEDFQRIIDQLV